MAPSALERHDLEQDIDELRGSIESLESSRSRLRDIVPEQGGTQSGSIWSDLTEIVTDFFQIAGATVSNGSDDEGDDEDADETTAGSTTAKPKKGANIDWSKSLADAFGRLRERITGDNPPGRNTPAPVAELGGVLGELDSEIARLNADLQRKLDRVAELDRAIDDVDPISPVHPHHRDVVDDSVVVIPTDDDIDITPIPVDILPDVDVTPVVPDDDSDDIIIPPAPDVDITPVVDVIPDPDVVVPVVDDDKDDDTPAFDPNQQTEIGELDGAIYDVNEILAGGKTVADLRKYDVPAGVVKDAGVAPSAMLDGGYSLAELHEAGYQAGDLHGLASASDMRSAGYTASDMHGVFSIGDCVQAFSPHELRDAGFTVSDFHGLVSASDLRDVFSVTELRTVYNIGELRAAGFAAGDLHGAGFTWDEIASAGFTLSDLEGAGANDSVLRNLFPNEYAIDANDDT